MPEANADPFGLVESNTDKLFDDKLQFADSLPKTRSGKIMRRILKRIAANDVENMGDTTTLADPTVVDTLVEGRQ